MGNTQNYNRTSNDKPEIGSGLRDLDDGSVLRFLKSIAAIHNRNYVVQEVRGNLISEERTALMATFPKSRFKRIASVQVGEPTLEFKQKTQETILTRKQNVADAEFRAKKAQERAKREQERRQKLAEKARRKAEREQKKKEEEWKKKVEEERRVALEAAKAAALEKAKVEEAKEAEKKEGDEKKADEE